MKNSFDVEYDMKKDKPFSIKETKRTKGKRYPFGILSWFLGNTILVHRYRSAPYLRCGFICNGKYDTKTNCDDDDNDVNTKVFPHFNPSASFGTDKCSF